MASLCSLRFLLELCAVLSLDFSLQTGILLPVFFPGPGKQSRMIYKALGTNGFSVLLYKCPSCWFTA